MKQFELPVIYCKNFQEVTEAEVRGTEPPEKEYDTQMTLFTIPDNCFIRMNPQSDTRKTTLYFSPVEVYTLDLNYETARITLKELIK